MVVPFLKVGKLGKQTIDGDGELNSFYFKLNSISYICDDLQGIIERNEYLHIKNKPQLLHLQSVCAVNYFV